MKQEQLNTVTLNKKDDNYIFVSTYDGKKFSINLQKKQSKTGQSYIGGNEGENSVYIFKNESESPNAPQLKGKAVIDSTEYKFALWHRRGKSEKTGKEYDFFSGAIQKIEQQTTNDDLPF